MVKILFYYSSILSPLIALVIGKRLKTRSLAEDWILLLLTISLMSDLSSLVWALGGHSTYLIINIYQYVETLLVYLFFKEVLNSKLSIIFLVIILIVSVANHLIVGNDSLYSTAIAIKSIFFIILSLVYFVECFNKETNIFIENNFDFWVVVGFLVYFSGSLFSWLLGSYNPIGVLIPWMFHNFSNILKNILFAIGFWKARQVQSPYP